MKNVFTLVALLITTNAHAGLPGWQTQCVAKSPADGWVTIYWGAVLPSKGGWSSHSLQQAEVVGNVKGHEFDQQVTAVHYSLSTRCGSELGTDLKLADGTELSFSHKGEGGCGGPYSSHQIWLPGETEAISLKCEEQVGQ